ncbi:MAG: hypothetical protein RLZZ57_3247 [Pseudomonadota bacterium]|jgi:Ca2+-binding RTX toxin-like protein
MPNVTATSGADTITPGYVSAGVVGMPGDGDDSIVASHGDDSISGGLGDDTISGDPNGGGYDRLSYDDATGGITVDMGAGTSSGAAGNDRFSQIDVIHGSSHDDFLRVGNTDYADFLAGAGADTLTAEGGAGGHQIISFRGVPIMTVCWAVMRPAVPHTSMAMKATTRSSQASPHTTIKAMKAAMARTAWLGRVGQIKVFLAAVAMTR